METVIENAYFSDNTINKKAHYHDSHQIILIKKGDLEFCINSAKQTASTGDVLVLSRFENHSIEVKSEEYERYVLYLSPRANSGFGSVFSSFSGKVATNENFKEFEELFKKIIKEQKSSQRFSSEMLNLLTNELLISIYRKAETPLYFEEEGNRIIFDILRRFEQNCSERYSLSSLSSDYNISASSLSHRFKTVTGRSVMGYLNDCRLAAAKNLLARTDLSVSEIVEKCGFPDASNFCRSFKEVSGITPLGFRNKYKK